MSLNLPLNSFWGYRTWKWLWKKQTFLNILLLKAFFVWHSGLKEHNGKYIPSCGSKYANQKMSICLYGIRHYITDRWTLNFIDLSYLNKLHLARCAKSGNNEQLVTVKPPFLMANTGIFLGDRKTKLLMKLVVSKICCSNMCKNIVCKQKYIHIYTTVKVTYIKKIAYINTKN